MKVTYEQLPDGTWLRTTLRGEMVRAQVTYEQVPESEALAALKNEKFKARLAANLPKMIDDAWIQHYPNSARGRWARLMNWLRNL